MLIQIAAGRDLDCACYHATRCIAARALIGTGDAEQHTDGAGHIRLGKDWYKKLINRSSHRICKVKAKTNEDRRVKWSKSQRLMAHFKILEEQLLKAGIAIRNPEHVEGGSPEGVQQKDHRFNQPILIDQQQAHRMVSLDETGFCFDATDKHGMDVLVGPEEAMSGDVQVLAFRRLLVAAAVLLRQLRA